MQLAVSLPMLGVSLPDSVRLVGQAQRWGYTAAWGSEVAGPDFASLLGAVAVASDVDLGVAVAPAQTRTPWLLAATAASLSHLSGGRFSLGLGTSSEVIVGQWSGLPFRRPLAQLRETVEVVRAMLAGEKVSHDGEFITTAGYRLFAPPPAPVPIVVGALNERSLRQAGEIGDGLALNQVAAEDIGGMLDQWRAGAEAAGRSVDGLPVVDRLFCLVTDRPDDARDFLRGFFAPYVATSVYNRFYRAHGFEQEADAVLAAMKERDRAAAAAAVSDRLLNAVTAIGSADEVADRVRAYIDAGVTVPVIACLAPGEEAHTATLRAVGERLG
ncbi:MAG TPA: LLM class flavin-dependent oxidoreductase [Egibacteraceae bacterium]|nr:LLM class flavin-dependent oxidoreductase [Egibacteraceae bacterium]